MNAGCWLRVFLRVACRSAYFAWAEEMYLTITFDVASRREQIKPSKHQMQLLRWSTEWRSADSTTRSFVTPASGRYFLSKSQSWISISWTGRSLGSWNIRQPRTDAKISRFPDNTSRDFAVCLLHNPSLESQAYYRWNCDAFDVDVVYKAGQVPIYQWSWPVLPLHQV